MYSKQTLLPTFQTKEYLESTLHRMLAVKPEFMRLVQKDRPHLRRRSTVGFARPQNEEPNPETEADTEAIAPAADTTTTVD